MKNPAGVAHWNLFEDYCAYCGGYLGGNIYSAEFYETCTCDGEPHNILRRLHYDCRRTLQVQAERMGIEKDSDSVFSVLDRGRSIVSTVGRRVYT